MFVTKPLDLETVNAPFYFAAEPEAGTFWPRQNTLLWRCLSMLIAGVTVTVEEFRAVSKRAKLEVLIWTLRGLGWPVKSHVAESINGIADETRLSYFIGDADKRTILEGDK